MNCPLCENNKITILESVDRSLLNKQYKKLTGVEELVSENLDYCECDNCYLRFFTPLVMCTRLIIWQRPFFLEVRGWATWKDRWVMFESDGEKLLNELKRRKLTKYFDLNGAYGFTRMLADQIVGKNNSWAVRWHASAFLSNKYTLYPGNSLVLNIGNDASGTHCGVTDLYSSQLSDNAINVNAIAVEDNEQSLIAIERFFRKQKGGLLVRFFQLLAKRYRKVVK